MPYSQKHKKTTQKKILESAIRLFSTRGFNQVSIEDLMNDAGLTRGAFYTHFASKKAVYSKAIIAGAKKSRIRSQKPKRVTQEEWTRNLLFGYLSKEHIKQEISPCPLAFLVTDIANTETEVKATYTRIYKMLNKTIQLQLTENSESKKQDILATTAMMIGGVAIGRALNDDVLTQKLLESCQQASLDLLGISNN